MKGLALITARGGSKRIPKKNIKDFLGKPIIAYSIETALKSRLFDEVMVSTDSEEIAAVAKQYGASIPFMRSEKTSGDFAGTFEVVDEVLCRYKSLDYSFDYACCIYPTAPFISVKLLQQAKELLLSDEKIYQVSPIVKFSFPPQRAFVLEDQMIAILNKEDFAKRSQDLRPLYHDAGQFYFYRFDKYNAIDMVKHWAGIELDELYVQDIDTIDDWKLAEIKYEILQRQKLI